MIGLDVYRFEITDHDLHDVYVVHRETLITYMLRLFVIALFILAIPTTELVIYILYNNESLVSMYLLVASVANLSCIFVLLFTLSRYISEMMVFLHNCFIVLWVVYGAISLIVENDQKHNPVFITAVVSVVIRPFCLWYVKRKTVY